MSSLPKLALHRPRTTEEALELISMEDLPYAGGTELLIALRQGLLQPRSLVDLKGIDALHQIAALPDHLALGGGVTHRRAASHPDVARSLPILPQVLHSVGNPRVQTAGTLAGNICFAEPKSDVIPLLIALQAEVVLDSPKRQRAVPVEDFVLGPYATSREEQELVVEIRVPLVEGRRAAYVKYQTMERPTVGVAAAATPRSGGVTTRVVVGAAGAVPVIAESAEGSIDPGDLAHRIEPLDDLTGSAEYKRHVTAVYVTRALEQLEMTG